MVYDRQQNTDVSHQEGKRCFLNEFTLFHKLSIRFCLYGFFTVGLLGIFLESVPLGMLYLLFMAVMGPVLIACHCTHCPYPYQSKTCLAMPYWVITRLEAKTRQLRGAEKTVIICVLSVAMLFPQYFLFQRLPLFVLYWILCLPTCVVFPAYFCRHCKFENCLFHPR